MAYRKHSKHEAMAAHGERLKALFGPPRYGAPAQPVFHGVLHCAVSSSVLILPSVVSTTAALRLTSNSDYSKLRDNWPYCLYWLIRGPPRQFNPPLYL